MNAIDGHAEYRARQPRAPLRRGTVVSVAGQGACAPNGEQLALLVVEIGARRDRQAFVRVYDYFAPRVKSFLMRSGLPAITAEELAQETMMAVWAKAASFDPAKAAASTWVFTIARNLRIDHLRRQRPTAEIGLTFEEEPDDAPDGEASLLVAERDAQLRSALAGLSPEQATIVRLCYFHDKAHSEIARELGLPLGTVKSRVRLALGRMRALLEGGA